MLYNGCWNRGIGALKHLPARLEYYIMSDLNKISKGKDLQSNRAEAEAASKAAEASKQDRIYQAALNMPEFNMGEGVKSFVKIDPSALALSRTILRDLKTRHGARKINGKLTSYARRNGASYFTTMSVAKFEQEVLGASPSRGWIFIHSEG